MKIAFVAINAKYIHTSLSVRCLMRYAEQEKVPAEMVICEWNINSLRQDVLAELYQKKADVYCFSVYIFNRVYLIPIIHDLKLLLPNAVIVCGGPEVSGDPEAFFTDFPEVDFLSLGEGEKVLSELLTRLSANDAETVKNSYEEGSGEGVAYLFNNSIKIIPNLHPVCALDMLPFPYTSEELDCLSNRILYFETSRGCPYFCSYCVSGREKGVRSFSDARTEKDLLELLSHPLRQIKFVDRTFNYDPKRALSILRFISEHHNGVTNFHFEIAPWLLDEDTLDFLQTVPRFIFRFEAGIQTTNVQTLRAIRRYVDLSFYRERLHRLIDMGFTVHLDLIAGLPYESFDSFSRSFDEVISLQPEELQLGFLKVLKGTETSEDTESGNVFEPVPPYTLLYNRFLSFDEMECLRRIEKLHDRLYNGNMMKKTLFAAADLWYNGSMFTLLWELEKEAEKKSVFDGEWSSEFLFRFVFTFLSEKKNHDEVLRQLLCDYILFSSPSVLPVWANEIAVEDKTLHRSLLQNTELLNASLSVNQRCVFESIEPKKWSRNSIVIHFLKTEKLSEENLFFLYSRNLEKEERLIVLHD